MTEAQEKTYADLRDAGWDYSYMVDGAEIFMTLRGSTMESTWVISEIAIMPDGTTKTI